MKYRSHAKWPKGTCDSSNNVSTDDHDTREQAEAVCMMLTQNGFGGDGKVFPLCTWVGDDPAPTPPKPDAGETPRTDANYKVRPWLKDNLDFARQLERDLHAAQTELAEAREKVSDALKWIEDNSSPDSVFGRSLQSIKQILTNQTL